MAKMPVKKSRSYSRKPVRKLIRKENNRVFRKKVLSVIHRKTENKAIQFYENNVSISDYATGSILTGVNTLFYTTLSPNALTLPISQGATQQQRIGNSIDIRKVTFRGIITPNLYSISTTPVGTLNNAPQPFLFKMWIGYQRNTALNYPDPTFSQLFQSGSTSVNPSSNILDTFRKINTDKYTVLYTRTFKVGNSGITTTQDTPAVTYNQGFVNNDYKLNQTFSIDVTKHVIKHVKYNDTGQDPTTRGLFAWFEAVAVNGDSFVLGRYPAMISYEIDLQYEDA